MSASMKAPPRAEVGCSGDDPVIRRMDGVESPSDRRLVAHVQADLQEALWSGRSSIGEMRRLATTTMPPPLRVLALHPQLEVDLRLEDGVEDLLAERIDLAIRLSPVHHLDAVVRRVTNTSLVCTGSHHYFER